MFSNQSGLNMDTILNSFLPHGIAQNQAPTSLWHSQWTWRRPQLNMKALWGLTDRKYKCILTGFLQGLWTRQQPQKPHGQCLPQNHLGGEALENGNRLNLRRWATWFSYEGKCWTGELIYLHWESAVEAHLWGLCIPQKHTQSPHLRRIIYECVKLWKFDITTHLWKVQTWKLRQSWFSPLACCEPDSFRSDHRVDNFNWFPSLI